MDLPPDTTIRWLVRRYADILAHDEDRNTNRPIVLPSGDFFPDDFDGDAGSVNLLFWRLQEHSGLTDIDVELRFLDDGGAAASGCGCSSGGCGPKAGGCGPGGKSATPPPVPPIDRLADGYRVDVLISQARTPVTLTTYLATALARVYLEESVGLKGFPQNEWRSTCELAAVSLGFGVLIANASHIFSKGCGGVRVERSTALTVEESALALALFVALREKTQSFKAEMAATQQSAFSEATLWTDSNQKVINRLKRDPAEVARDDMLELREAKPWLARVLGLGRRKRSSEVFDDEGLSQFESEMKERSSGATKRRAKASSEDLRALVDESLEGVRAAREHAARLAQQR